MTVFRTLRLLKVGSNIETLVFSMSTRYLWVFGLETDRSRWNIISVFNYRVAGYTTVVSVLDGSILGHLPFGCLYTTARLSTEYS